MTQEFTLYEQLEVIFIFLWFLNTNSSVNLRTNIIIIIIQC
jgi:hypothetical protein